MMRDLIIATAPIVGIGVLLSIFSTVNAGIAKIGAARSDRYFPEQNK